MTATAVDRKAPQYGTPDAVVPYLINLPMAATTLIYAGTMVAADASGNAVGGSASTALKLAGRAEAHVDNSSGGAGALTINVKPGVFAFVNSAAGVDLIAAANVFSYCYVVDNQTVALTDGGGTRPIAGLIFPFDPNNPTAVQVGVGPGFTVPSNPNAPTPGGSTQFKARGAAFATNHSLTAFTVATNTDGITYVAGDVVLLTAQTTAKENGPYVVGTVATTAPLTRPDWWVAGSAIAPGQVIQVSEGTIFAGSEWKAFCGKAKVIDTDDPTFYPRVSKGTVTLASGTKVLGVTQGLFLRSTTTSAVMITRNTFHAGSTTTVTYDAPVANRTAGVAGTAALSIFGAVAAGTHPGDDASDVDFLVVNW
jgi:hypothetical protein